MLSVDRQSLQSLIDAGYFLQGIDTEDNVMMPKVIEALLGTRFFGRSFMTAPLVGLQAWL